MKVGLGRGDIPLGQGQVRYLNSSVKGGYQATEVG